MSRPLFLPAKPLQAEREPTLGWNNISLRDTLSVCVTLAKNESVTTRPPGSELHDQANLWGLLFDEKFWTVAGSRALWPHTEVPFFLTLLHYV